MTNGLSNHPVDTGPHWIAGVVWLGMTGFGSAIIALVWAVWFSG
jgi:hypothetical protein